MTCAADILTALDGLKPTVVAETASFLHTLAECVAQAVASYILASVTTSSGYSGAVIGTGTGAFTALTPALLSALFEAGLNAPADVDNKVAEGFALGLHAMCVVGTVTEAASGVTTAVPPVPVTFTGLGSVHVAAPPPHAACVAVLERMASEKPAAGTVNREEEIKKLKLLANSFAQLVDDFIPTIVINTSGAGAVGLGAATSSELAVDPTFPT